MFSAASKTDNVSSAANYIEDVFSTYLYTGNGSTQTITNGIDLSTKGGLVWTKIRGSANDHILVDTNRGTSSGYLATNANYEQSGSTYGVTGFTTSGYTTNSDAAVNGSGSRFVSWTFEKQAKFFDIQTYTGSTGAVTINHNLGSTPGCVIIKCTSNARNWMVWHRSLTTSQYLYLNTTDSVGSLSNWISVSSTQITIQPNASGNPDANYDGRTYVAYIFAHDAGGFGTSGADNVISCGSFTPNGSGIGSVTLGWEPQFVLLKASTTAQDWQMLDVMRGFSAAPDASNQILNPNLSSAEFNQSGGVAPNATGFASVNAGLSGSQTYIYIAIRRGPMKTPTSGTSVFSPITVNAPANTQQTTNFPVDMQIMKNKSDVDGVFLTDRLRGINSIVTSAANPRLLVNGTNAESSPANFANNWNNTGFAIPSYLSNLNGIFWSFGRAPSFFDEVCFSGTGAVQNVSHNLGVAPEMMILKQRNGTTNWFVYHAALGNTKAIYLDSTSAASSASSSFWNNTSPTSSVFTVSFVFDINAVGSNSVAYLFASCPGVSKVGSYSGTGGTQTISCGFAARFVLIKRTDSTGNWFVWDTARGMVAGTDPRLALNSSAAEVNENWVYTNASGFQIVTTDATVNASGGSYIFLAIA